MEQSWKAVILCLCLLLLDCSLASTPDNNEDLSADDLDVYQGDIILSDEQKYLKTKSEHGLQKRSVMRLEIHKWIGGVVPYELSSDLSEEARSVVVAAINQYRMDTCITFRERRVNDLDYVYFHPGKGCYSFVGRYGGMQNISIGDNCQQKGIVMHEIFHALGRWHEQSRPDRDLYVRISRENIEEGRHNNFATVDISRTTTQGIPYDYDSIMHYDAYAFSRNSNPTIRPLNDSIPLERLGQRRVFSERDLQHIRQLYCQGKNAEWSTWGPWSNCSRSCGEGEQERHRVCIRGSNSECAGSSIEKRMCNLGDCNTRTGPRWGPWGGWTGCNKVCGGGQRTRFRVCENGNTCVGLRQEFEECNTHPCLPKWSVWSEWSECNQSCRGGVRYRSRSCIGRDDECKQVVTPVLEYEECNTNITCGPGYDEWTECSRTCGGGVQFKRISEDTVINRTCNEYPCHKEHCLEGLVHIGCYKLPRSTLDVYENTVPELQDSNINRSEPIRKCAKVAMDNGIMYFALAEGVCFGGSNKLDDFTGDGESGVCEDGLGKHIGGKFMIDVYHIDDVLTFQASSNAAESCGMNYCLAETVVCSGASRVSAPEVRTCILIAFFAILRVVCCVFL